MTSKLYTEDDAIAAAEIIREADAGHEAAAEALLLNADLGDLTDDQLRDLADLFGAEI